MLMIRIFWLYDTGNVVGDVGDNTLSAPMELRGRWPLLLKKQGYILKYDLSISFNRPLRQPS